MTREEAGVFGICTVFCEERGLTCLTDLCDFVTEEREKVKATFSGTPAARFHWLLNELEQRFPDTTPYLSAPTPEEKYLAAIDRLTAHVNTITKVSQEYVDELAQIKRERDNERAVKEQHSATICRIAKKCD